MLIPKKGIEIYIINHYLNNSSKVRRSLFLNNNTSFLEFNKSIKAKPHPDNQVHKHFQFQDQQTSKLPRISQNLRGKKVDQKTAFQIDQAVGY